MINLPLIVNLILLSICALHLTTLTMASSTNTWRRDEEVVKSRVNSTTPDADLSEQIQTFFVELGNEIRHWRSLPDEVDDDDDARITSNLVSPRMKHLVGNVSSECLNQTGTLLEDFYSDKQYALQMYYSSGDLPGPRSQLTADTTSLGLFDECRAVKRTNEDTPFDAEYCTISLNLPFGHRVFYLSPHYASYSIGQCLPASCSEPDIRVFLTMMKDTLKLEGARPTVLCDNAVPYDGPTIFVICLCILLVSLMIAGTTYDLYTTHCFGPSEETYKPVLESNYTDMTINDKASIEHDDNEVAVKDNGAGMVLSPLRVDKSRDADCEEPTKGTIIEEKPSGSSNRPIPKDNTPGLMGKVLMCFSVRQNCCKLFDTRKSTSMFSAFNGIRVLSMFWVICGHTWLIFINKRIDNSKHTSESLMDGKIWTETIKQGTLAVDTFLLLSGLLVTYITMKTLTATGGKLHWLRFYLHRIWRITPLYMFVVGFYSTMIVHLNSGPGKNNAKNIRIPCERAWWTNLLFINNLVPFPGTIMHRCVPWTWYLAVDMQFYMISPIIIIILYKYRNCGFALIAALFVTSYSITIALSIYFGYTTDDFFTKQRPYNNRNPFQQEDWLYTKPYYRLPAYLVGMILGYIMFKLDGKKVYISRLTCTALWTVAIFMLMSTVYGLYRGSTVQHSQSLAVFYRTVSSTSWSVAVGWIAFACIKGYGGPVNKILSWSIWTPLARLTFSTYLVHSIVIIVYAFSLRTRVNATLFTMTVHNIAFTVISFTVGLVFSLAIEAPMMRLEQLIFPRRRNLRKHSPQSANNSSAAEQR